MENAAINHYTPDYTVTPGEVLGYELKLRNTSRTELVKRTGLSEKHIIASVEQWDDIWPNVAIAYRLHNKHEIFPEAVSVWLRKGELEATAIACQPFNKVAFRQALDDIHSLTAETDPTLFVPALQQRCAKFEVAVVFVPNLPKTGVSGATRWVNPDKASMQLSLRYKTNDYLWLTFFHEAGYILLNGKKGLFIEGANGMDDEKEAQAPFSKVAIQRFAREFGIALGIVFGQLQHKNLLPKTHCNDLKVSYEWRHKS